MDELYGIIPENLIQPSDYQSLVNYESLRPIFGSTISETASTNTNHHEIRREDHISTAIKARIASHPRYPSLLQAYIDCQKVGAPPEITCLLEEIRRENNDVYQFQAACSMGSDPELDEFMETYCEMLVKYKSDLARPFDEATLFLNKMETQLGNLCNGVSITTTSPSDDGNVSSDEEFSGGEVEAQEAPPKCNDRDLKDRLIQKYGGRIGSLQLEFSKKKKKGKLPKEARQTLLEWWNSHYRWPYPTEGDKLALAALTSLDPKQINNWFINQRKRHWKPSENMQYPFTDHLSG